jgi:hypothetical protein
LILTQVFLLIVGIAEVVGSNNPTRSISSILVSYGFGLSSLLVIVG